MRLSVLICSLHRRKPLLDRLLAVLEPQLTGDVQLLIDADNGETVTGIKRQRQLEQSTGQWVCWIDDDDLVSGDYVACLLDALEHNPDCVGFKVNRYKDGRRIGKAIHSLRYQRFGKRLDEEGLVYERTPNHLNPVRRELALATGFKPWLTAEDIDYACRLRPLLKTEQFIGRYLYDYLLLTRK
jgi:glycosyltransferase involved in cell wall biosynthesis